MNIDNPELIDAIALAMRNEEAGRKGWPPISSLDSLEDEGAAHYRAQAQVAVNAVGDWLTKGLS